ncbi:MAG: FKBP-type peptidylprolyl isomerase [Planctomycetota bacterium]|jgi:FKBP-type peptidyl-prolyl cis-trans isomerase FkpA
MPVPHSGKPVATAALLLTFGLLAGCESPAGSRMADSEDSGSAAAPSQREIVTFFDRESLQAGVGPVDQDASREFQTTASGLKYRILRNSDGSKPQASSTVEVHYRGWLDSGRQFDNSYDRGETTSFPLNGVIPAWTEGLQLIGEGGMIELWVPSELGYGSRGMPGSIPPNATLHFIVELKRVM